MSLLLVDHKGNPVPVIDMVLMSVRNIAPGTVWVTGLNRKRFLEYGIKYLDCIKTTDMYHYSYLITMDDYDELIKHVKPPFMLARY